jgi:hypothetical protein
MDSIFKSIIINIIITCSDKLIFILTRNNVELKTGKTLII